VSVHVQVGLSAVSSARDAVEKPHERFARGSVAGGSCDARARAWDAGRGALRGRSCLASPLPRARAPPEDSGAPEAPPDPPTR
jgi:hypothetical protein